MSQFDLRVAKGGLNEVPTTQPSLHTEMGTKIRMIIGFVSCVLIVSVVGLSLAQDNFPDAGETDFENDACFRE